MTENIIEKDYNKEMKQSFIDYAMKTITDRALPDVRDGMKPVHRRIMYGMKELRLTNDKAHKKSARIVGDVMGKYHPHGDSSVYMAMVRLSQDFSVKLPLVDGHGNFGSIDGDSPAAMRYTEARMSKMAEWLLADMDKEVVEYRSNYDDTEREPVVLPARFPHLLINGSEGIATGMATNIPTHNPTEVANAWIYALKTKRPTIKGMMKHINAPDLPMGGQIVNEEEMQDFYRKGQARIMTRGVYHVEDAGYGKQSIVFTEMPKKSVGNKNGLVNHLIQKVNDKTLDEVTDIRDESSREGMRLVIEVRKGTEIESFVNKLWVKTNLQDSERIQFLVLVDGQPETLNILEYFKHYVSFQKELITNEHTYLLKRTNKRLHLLAGLIKAHDRMDTVIDVIRGSDTVEESKNCLMNGDTTGIDFRLKRYEGEASQFCFSEEQAEAIMSMRLQKLVGMEREKLVDEQATLNERKKEYEEILSSDERLTELCVQDAERFKKEFQSPRVTTVTTKDVKQVIAKVNVRDVVLSIDRFGLVKMMDEVDSADEGVRFQLETRTDRRLSVFTSQGNLYQVKCEDIPQTKKTDRGTPIQLLAKMSPDEAILYATVDDQLDGSAFLFITKHGNVKLVEGKEFATNRSKLKATNLQKRDEVACVLPYKGEAELAFVTYKERGLRVKAKELPVFGRNTKGNMLARLGDDDHITAASFTAQTNLNMNGVEIPFNKIPVGKIGLTAKPV